MNKINKITNISTIRSDGENFTYTVVDISSDGRILVSGTAELGKASIWSV